MGNNKLTVISSQGIEQWNTYGKDLVDTFLKHWPTEIVLQLYTEDIDKFSLSSDRVNLKDLVKLAGNDYKNFIESVPNNSIWDRCKKFSKKAFSIIDALDNTNEGFLIWIDADVKTKKDIPLSMLENICPEDCLTAHLGLTQYIKKFDKRVYSSETGFFIINCEHPHKKYFLDEYRRSYVERDFEGLRKPFDAEVFARTIKKLEAQHGTKYKELSPDLNLLGPFRKSVLAEYMYHYKAKHKKKLV